MLNLDEAQFANSRALMGRPLVQTHLPLTILISSPFPPFNSERILVMNHIVHYFELFISLGKPYKLLFTSEILGCEYMLDVIRL